MKTRILKSQVGRSLDFRSSQNDEQPINGVIERVKNGVASVRFHVVRANDGSLRTFNKEGFIAYLDVRDLRIIEVY